MNTDTLKGEAKVSPFKRCGKCGQEKPLEAFSRRTASKDGRQSQCRSCNAQWQRDNPEKRRETWRRYRRAHYLRIKYNMTDEQYWVMFGEQNGRCAICQQEGREHQLHPVWQRPLHIDHDHERGNVRGLLCHECNAALGFLHEDEARFLGCIEYLRTRGGLKLASRLVETSVQGDSTNRSV